MVEEFHDKLELVEVCILEEEEDESGELVLVDSDHSEWEEVVECHDELGLELEVVCRLEVECGELVLEDDDRSVLEVVEMYTPEEEESGELELVDGDHSE